MTVTLRRMLLVFRLLLEEVMTVTLRRMLQVFELLWEERDDSKASSTRDDFCRHGKSRAPHVPYTRQGMCRVTLPVCNCPRHGEVTHHCIVRFNRSRRRRKKDAFLFGTSHQSKKEN